MLFSPRKALTLCIRFEDIFIFLLKGSILARLDAFDGKLPKNKNIMDVISEIKKFEQHPDRKNFSSLQVNDFYKKLAGQPFKFEAIISSVRKGTNSDYEISADTYHYSIQHNPVTDRDYVNWMPDMSFIGEAAETLFKFNPITDLIRGDRFHCSATFIRKEDKDIRVQLNSFEKKQFLEVEEEKNLLEKRFNSDFKERNVYAPQRQFQKRAFDKTMMYFALGGLIGCLLGLFWGGLGAMFDSDASILIPGIEGGLIGGVLAGGIGMIRGLLGPRKM
jgi:hypothetical protein